MRLSVDENSSLDAPATSKVPSIYAMSVTVTVRNGSRAMRKWTPWTSRSSAASPSSARCTSWRWSSVDAAFQVSRSTAKIVAAALSAMNKIDSGPKVSGPIDCRSSAPRSSPYVCLATSVIGDVPLLCWPLLASVWGPRTVIARRGALASGAHRRRAAPARGAPEKPCADQGDDQADDDPHGLSRHGAAGQEIQTLSDPQQAEKDQDDSADDSQPRHATSLRAFIRASLPAPVRWMPGAPGRGADRPRARGRPR